jgi:hypothetical protein
MATIVNQRHHHLDFERSTAQKVSLGLGVFFLVMGVVGILMPGLMGMHLSMANNLFHLISGICAVWCAYSDIPSRAQNFCLGFGTIYALLGLAGFFIGEEGYPNVGFRAADAHLLRVIPNVLEFGTMDHLVHLVVGVILFSSTFFERKKVRRNSNTDKKTVANQRL